MKIYRPPIVQELEAHYGELLFRIDQFPSIKAHLSALAHRMWEGLQAHQTSIFKEINNYHAALLGKSKEELIALKLSFEDCKTAIANEYGFDNWIEVEGLGELAYHFSFEQAVNHLLAGNLEALKKQIEQEPALVNCRSQYGHGATLLHYTASNGVEFWRQKVPLNLPAIVAYLIEAGADKRAQMKVYGGTFEPLPLLLSSAHPQEAGIVDELKKLLE